ncbi:hypothetical protein B5807_11687 [Epicoccum nigrum]|uniref:Uncharacterized protein n=1 Tax=Epicoccum nigrum TaxID=105696 RepID=A0A1Y2LIJ5_EPING|nr:hypothetical protein B5807_11687 [Epicoccum nigrum]
MTSSSRNKPKDRTHYAVGASKGFAYWLPKSAQSHLQSLLKQLPSTARSIYKEHYRDVMCGKACAAASVIAMADFILQFPKCAKKHNAFAREMNAEIERDEHDGYEPVFFPIVDEPRSESEGDGEDVEIQGRESGRRRRALDDAGASKKKFRNDQGSIPASPPRSDAGSNPLLTLNTHDYETPDLLSHSGLPPSHNPPSEERAVSQERTYQSEDNRNFTTTKDIGHPITRLSVAEDSIVQSLPTQATPPSPPNQQPIVHSNYHALQEQSNNIEIDIASISDSFIIGDVDDHTGRTSIPGVYIVQPIPSQLAPHLSSSQHTDAHGEHNSPQSFSQQQSSSAVDEFLNPPYIPYVSFPEDVTWDEAWVEIETFKWDKKGSR